MICQGSTCKSGRAECKSPALCRAMHAPLVRKGDAYQYLPRENAVREDARRKRNRRHFFLTVAVLGALVLARLVLRFFFPGVFA